MMKENIKKLIRYTASAALAAVLLWVSFRGVEWEDFMEGLRSCRWEFILLSMAAGSFAFWLRALRWRKLLLPIDTVIAADFPNPIDAEIAVETVPSDAIPADKMGLDIGENTRALFADAVKSAKTVVWNGPMGVFENPTLAKGTIAVAEALAESEAITIVGGGDSAAACEQLGFADRITHISTGGGASLEFLEGKELPGIACLLDK